MTGMPDGVPSYRTIRITAPGTDDQALADAEAALARTRYPHIMNGAPMFGAARELDTGGWEILHLSDRTPQQARDDLSPLVRRLAQQAAQAGDHAGHDECMQAAELIDTEVFTDLTVLSTRYRIVRCQTFICAGPDGPEPPRPADPDPHDISQANDDPVRGLVIDTINPATPSAGVLLLNLLRLTYPEAGFPPDVRADSVRALRTHPGGVLLPAAYIIGEHRDGAWHPAQGAPAPTPEAARDSLSWHLRVTVPYEQRLGEQEQAACIAAAAQLEQTHASELTAGERRFRVIRVERIIRMGPDGPEGPRPTDYDPEPPARLQEQQLRAEGKLAGDDEPLPHTQDPEYQRYAALARQEITRWQAADQPPQAG